MKDNNVRVIVKGQDKTDSILAWSENGETINITYSNGKTYPYNTNNVQIKQSALSTNAAADCFEYLKQIAHAVGLKGPDGGNILANRYEKIGFVSKESMLAAFLTGTTQMRKEENSYQPTLVYPFGFNASQKTAVDCALTNTLSIIEGPPGTGKTQTILNIIANAVMRGESVAVVSSNNSATANVFEKLQKKQVDYIAASLGNSDNKREFVESQKPLPDLSAFVLQLEQRHIIYRQLQSLGQSLSGMLEKKNVLSRYRQELSAIETEQKHFLDYADAIALNATSRVAEDITASQNALEMWLLCENYEEAKRKPGLISFIVHLFEQLGLKGKRGNKIRKLLEAFPREHLIEAFQNQFYELGISELTQTISALYFELEGFDFNTKMDVYAYLSFELFRDRLAEKYKHSERPKFELDDLWRNPQKFIEAYPVILSTTYSLRSCLSSQYMYDYVIIDEASQVDLATGALALSCARKAVVVGDLKQLPNVVDSEAAKKTDVIFSEFNLPEVYRYKNHSLLSAVSELFPGAPSTLLREHYRCHPKIIEFCNQKFYNNQLIILTEPKSDRKPLAVYKTVPGNHARQHVNQRQIDIIKHEIIPQQNLDESGVSVGIVTPYRNQTNALQKAFAETSIHADTVDKFQGRENDVIILSTVDNEISDFADNANRLNVAVSRAIEQLIVVVNSGDAMQDKNIGDLIRYVEYNNLEVIQSEVYSVFDYLYAGYREQRMALLRKQGKISEYDSENLMYGLIRQVLGIERFLRFDVACHVPLKMILRDMKKLDAYEEQYAQNILTHMDFLIFDRICKIPILAIEVDGVAFHAESTRQSERDKMKNSILDKYRLPYLRFKTDGSNEYNRLIEALDGF